MSNKDVSQIIASEIRNAIGKIESINYEWRGKSPYVRVSWNILEDFCKGPSIPEKIKIGPYKLIKIDDELSFGASLYVRSDKFGALRVALYKSTRLLDLVYRRTIITLAVWRLADFSPGVFPSWRDVKFLKWLSK